MHVLKGWACYDERVEALLSAGTAGVVESLLRMVACDTGAQRRVEHSGIVKQVHGSSRRRRPWAWTCISFWSMQGSPTVQRRVTAWGKV